MSWVGRCAGMLLPGLIIPMSMSCQWAQEITLPDLVFCALALTPLRERLHNMRQGVGSSTPSAGLATMQL